MPDLLYVDSSAFLDRALKQKRHTAIARRMSAHVRGGGVLVSSRLISLEARRVQLRVQVEGVDARAIPRLARAIQQLPLTDEVWQLAHDIDVHIKTLDSLHLATCRLANATLLTSDDRMREVAQHLGVPVSAIRK